jgi:multiple sugar transport system substrate-binding protein
VKKRLKGLTWDDPRGWGPLAAAVRAFQKTPQGQGVEITWDIQPLSGFESRSLAETTHLYDLIILDHPHIGEAAEHEWLCSTGRLPDDYVGPTNTSYRWANQQWAFPIDAACHVCAVREDSLEYCPAEITSLWATDTKVRFGIPLSGVHALMAMYSLATGLNDSDDKLHQAMELLHQLKTKAHPDSINWNPIQALQALVDRYVDVVLLTFNYIDFQTKSNVIYRPLPALHDIPLRGILGGTGLAVSSQCKYPETALDFGRFISSQEIQSGLWIENHGQPAHRVAWQKLATMNPQNHVVAQALEKSWVRPRFPGWNQMQSDLGKKLNHWLTDRQVAFSFEELPEIF